MILEQGAGRRLLRKAQLLMFFAKEPEVLDRNLSCGEKASQFNQYDVEQAEADAKGQQRSTDAHFLRPNVRAKRATTAGRQARAGENVPRTARPGLVACRWRSA